MGIYLSALQFAERIGRANVGDGMRRQAGFTILELLIVVGLIVIVAAIAIPNLLRSRVATAEASALDSLRAINAAQISYRKAYPKTGTPACQLSYLGPPMGSTQANSTAADLIDVQLSSGVKDGYNFSMNCTTPVGGGSPGYEVKAAPIGASITGESCGTEDGRCFYTNHSETVYQLNGTGNSYGTGFGLVPID